MRVMLIALICSSHAPILISNGLRFSKRLQVWTILRRNSSCKLRNALLNNNSSPSPMITTKRDRPYSLTASLTRREIETLTRVAQGQTARQVALSLGITKRTVSAHMQSICEKLDATKGAQAVAIRGKAAKPRSDPPLARDASRGLRFAGGFLQAVQKIRPALRVRGRGEDRPLVVLQHLDP